MNILSCNRDTYVLLGASLSAQIIRLTANSASIKVWILSRLEWTYAA